MKQGVWFISVLHEELKDATIKECFEPYSPLLLYLDDFIHLHP